MRKKLRAITSKSGSTSFALPLDFDGLVGEVELSTPSRSSFDDEATVAGAVKEGVGVPNGPDGGFGLGEGSVSGLKISGATGDESGIWRPNKPNDCLRKSSDEFSRAGVGIEAGSNHLAVGVGGSVRGAGLLI